MNDGTQTGAVAALGRAQAKIEQWRQRHRPRARIPEDLWREAAALAGAYGVHRTAKALRLDYYALKRRATAAAASGAAASGEGLAQFVEVLGGAPGGPGDECLIEVEDGGGATMRIRLPGREGLDLAALVRVFREGRG